MAPRNVSQTNSRREISSDAVMPMLKPYRNTTLPKTRTTIAARHSVMMIFSNVK